MRILMTICLTSVVAGCVSGQADRGPATLEERYSSLSGGARTPPTRGAATDLVADLKTVPTRRGPILVARTAGARTTRVELGGGRFAAAGAIDVSAAPTEALLREIEQPPTEASVSSALRKRFPTMAMKVVAEPRRNAYGSYGMAVGVASNGMRCAFGWQWIEPGTSLDRAASLRAQLCSSTLTLDDLAGLLDGLSLTPRAVAELRGQPRRDQATTSRRMAERRAGATVSQSRPVAEPDMPAVDRRVVRAPVLEAPQQRAPELDLPPQALRGPASSAGRTSLPIRRDL